MDTAVISNEEYKNFSAINYSTLSEMSKDPKNLLLSEQEKRHAFEANEPMKLGSLVDDMCFSPDSIKGKYFMSKAKFPTASMGELFTNYIASGGPVDDVDEDILSESRNAVGFQPKWGMEAVLRNFKADCGAVLEELRHVNGRIVISPSLNERATKTYTTLRTYPYMNIPELFAGEGTRTFKFLGNEKEWTVYYQLPLVFSISSKAVFDNSAVDKQVLCKAKPDIVLLSDNHAVVIDLKVIGYSPREFPSRWIKNNYHLQAGMYSYAVSEWLRDVLKIDMPFIIDFVFLPVNPESIPLLFGVDHSMVALGWSGGTLYSGTEILGIRDLVRQYLWHVKTGIYDHTPWEIESVPILYLRQS